MNLISGFYQGWTVSASHALKKSTVTCFFLFLSLPLLSKPMTREDASLLLKEADVSGGLVVYVGAKNGESVAAFHQSESLMVHGLITDEARVGEMREEVGRNAPYGEVTLGHLRGPLLPFVDNMVNLLVVENPEIIRKEEIRRVLTPDGVAFIKNGGEWEKTIKRRDSAIDNWTHYFYDAKGNAVSHDNVVAPPERLQWLGSPRWSRHHDRMSSLSAMVSN